MKLNKLMDMEFLKVQRFSVPKAKLSSACKIWSECCLSCKKIMSVQSQIFLLTIYCLFSPDINCELSVHSCAEKTRKKLLNSLWGHTNVGNINKTYTITWYFWLWGFIFAYFVCSSWRNVYLYWLHHWLFFCVRYLKTVRLESLFKVALCLSTLILLLLICWSHQPLNWLTCTAPMSKCSHCPCF